MLTARTKTGETICLGNNYRKEALLLLRNKEEFICPVCGEGVLLKLGDQRIYHFAHKRGGTCRELFESETLYHMEGKRQLYQWLVHQKIPAALEHYDPQIQQRPDIVFNYKGIKYALEYQCSPIAENIFRKRNKAYDQNGYFPLWIIGSKNIKSKRNNIFSFSSFDYFFLRKAENNQYLIPSYCPENSILNLFCSIQSLSIKNALAKKYSFSITQTDLEHVLKPRLNNQVNINCWNAELEKFIYHSSIHPSPQISSFLREIYNNNLNLCLMPPEIGLPIQHSFLIQTPPIIWQAYFYLDVLMQKMPGESINIMEAERFLNKRIMKKQMITRKLPQVDKLNPMHVVIDYLLQLEKIGIVIRRGETDFQVLRKLIIPQSNRQRGEQLLQFKQRYKKVLSEI